jgi:hypothetical protein
MSFLIPQLMRCERSQQEQERFEEQRKIARKIRAPKMKIGEMLDDEKSLLGSQTELASVITLQPLQSHVN